MTTPKECRDDDCGSIVERAIDAMRKAEMSDCEIGHNLVAAGVRYLEDSLVERGIRRADIIEQLNTAKQHIDNQLAGLRQEEAGWKKHCLLIGEPQGSA